MGTTLTGKRVQNTYDSLLKLSDNDNLTGTPKIVGSGLGTDSPIYLSTTKVGIGMSPSVQFQTSGDAQIGNNLVVGGNLTVNGTTTYIDSTIVEIGDNMIELAKDNTANIKDIGWYGTINDGSEKYVGVFYDASTGTTTPEFHVGLGTAEPSSTAAWTVKGKLVIGDIDSTGGTFSGQITIPETPTADGHAASKKYVDDQIGGADKARRVTITVKNTETVALSAGTVVHAEPTASPPSGNVVQVKKADYDTSSLMPGIGILNEDLDAAGGTNDEGEAIMFGFINGIDTSSFSAGDELYVGNDGALTNSKPLLTTQLIQKIAVVMKVDSTNGSIEVFGAGRSNDVPNEVDRDLSIAGNLTVDDYIDVEAASGYGRIEIGGPTGGYIDLKTPFSDDYDLRMIFDSGGANITSSSTLRLNSSNTNAVLIDANQDTTFLGNIYANADIIFGGNDTYNATINYIDNGAGDHYLVFQTQHNGTTDDTLKLHAGTKLATFSGDITVLDAKKIYLGSDSDLEIYHDGADGYIDNINGELIIQNNSDDKKIIFKSDNGIGGITDYFIINGNINLNEFKISTRHNDNVKAFFGDGSDLQIYSDGTVGYIKGDDVRLVNASGENIFRVNGDLAELYYNDSKKLETTNTGINVTGDGNFTGNINISSIYPRINLTDTNNNDDWSIINADGIFRVYNSTDAVDSFDINSDNNATFAGNITLGANYIGRDADNYIDFSTDNEIDFKVGGGVEITLDASQLYPVSNFGSSVGKSTNRWDYVYARYGNFSVDLTTPLLTLSDHLVIENDNSTFSVPAPANTNVPLIYLRNTNNTSGATTAHSIITLRTQINGGDPFISFDVENETGWTAGMDNSDNKFKITTGWNDVGGTTGLIISTTGELDSPYFAAYSNVNSTGDGGAFIKNGQRLGFDESGTRSWTMKAASGQLQFLSGDNLGAAYFYQPIHAITSGSAQNLDLVLNNTAGGSTDRVRIKTTANSVAWDLENDQNLTAFKIRYTTGGSDVVVLNNGSAANTIVTNSTGVGIGMTPSYKLDVNGNSRITGTTQTLRLWNSASNTGVLDFGQADFLLGYDSGTFKHRIWDGADYFNAIQYNGPAHRLLLALSEGSVLIGSSVQYFSEKLVVNGLTRTLGLHIAQGVGYSNYGNFTHDDNNMTISTTRVSGNGHIVLNPYGNVGIKTTTNISSPLTVQTDGSANSISIIGRNNGTSDEAIISFYEYDGTTRNSYIVKDGGNLSIATGTGGSPSERMKILSTGEVKIVDNSVHDNTDANNRLHISRNNHAYIKFSTPDNYDQGLHFYNTTDNSNVGRIAYLHSSSGDKLDFIVGGSDVMELLGGGGMKLERSSDPFIQFYEGTSFVGDVFVDTSENNIVLRGATGHGVRLISNAQSEGGQTGITLRTDNKVSVNTTGGYQTFYVNGDMGIPGTNKIVFNNEPSAWYIQARTTTSTSFMGTQLKNLINCGGGANEGLAIGGVGTGDASFEVKNDGTAKVKSRLAIGGNSLYGDLEVSCASKSFGEGIILNPDTTYGWSALFWRLQGATGSNYSGTWFMGKQYSAQDSAGECLQVGKEGLTGGSLLDAKQLQRWYTNGNVGFGFNVAIGTSTTTPSQRLHVAGNIYVEDGQTTGLGVILRNGDRPMITRGWDAFTSGSFTGIGRWGLFMQPATTFLASPGTDYTNGLVSLGGFTASGTAQYNLTVNNYTRRVGIGTTTPSVKLQVSDSSTLPLKVESDNSVRTEIAVDNISTNNVRLGLKATSGGAIIDSTNHTGSSVQPLLFQINASTKMQIDTSGRVGINESSPATDSMLSITSSLQYGLQIGHNNANSASDFQDCLFVKNTNSNNSNYVAIGMSTNGTDGQHHRVQIRAYKGGGNYEGQLRFYMRQTTAANTERYRFYANGEFHADSDIVAFSTTISDKRLKDEVVTIDSALDKVKSLRGVEYVWNSGSKKGKKDLGVIAQEVEEILPEIVTEKEMAFFGEEKYKTVDYEKLTAVLIESVKELSAKVEALENRNCNCNCK